MDFSLLLLNALFAVCFSEYVDIDDSHVPQPYTFGYEIRGQHGDQWRNEVSDGTGGVHGSYGFVDPDGLRREVKYVADDNGFRARIRTNEPHMDQHRPADVLMLADPPYDVYDAASIYGVERLNAGAAPPPRSAVPTRRRRRRQHRRVVEPEAPPVFVVDGHLQSPWFPMDTVAEA